MPQHQIVQCDKFGPTSTNASSQVPTDQQLHTYTDHYGGKWVGKKRDFVNMPIYTYESLGSVGHIMVGKPTKLSTDTATIEFTIAEPPWSTLYEKRCELEVYCRWHRLRVPKAHSAELPSVTNQGKALATSALFLKKTSHT